MKHAIGFAAKRMEDGSFGEPVEIFRDIPDEEIGASGLTKLEEQCLETAAERIFLKLFREHKEKLKAKEVGEDGNSHKR